MHRAHVPHTMLATSWPRSFSKRCGGVVPVTVSHSSAVAFSVQECRYNRPSSWTSYWTSEAFRVQASSVSLSLSPPLLSSPLLSSPLSSPIAATPRALGALSMCAAMCTQHGYASPSSGAASIRRSTPPQSAGNPARRCQPARCGCIRAPLSTSSGNSHHHSRSCPSKPPNVVPPSGRTPCEARAPFCL